jgi:hypothetical protein
LLITGTDPFIRGWIYAKNTGYEVGDWTDDKKHPGNTIGINYHKDAPSNGEYYSVDGQNCIWWVTTMLMQSGIKVPLNVYTEIDNYNRGYGDDHQMIQNYKEEIMWKSRPTNLDWSGTPGDFPGGLNFGF